MKISCPHCGQHYELEDSAVGSVATCENCWKDFTVGEEPPPPLPETKKPPRPVSNPAPTATRCPFCGGEIAPGVKKCRHCGEWLEKNNKGTIKALVIVGVVLLVAAAVALAVRDYKNMKKTELEGAHEAAALAKEQSERTQRLVWELEEYEARLLRLRSQTNLTSIERQEEAYLVKKLRDGYAKLGIEYKDVVGK